MNKTIRMIRQWSLYALLAPALFLTACKDDDDGDNAAPKKTITQTVVDDPNFSLLEAAVVEAGLANALSTGTLTVFAPTNDAFKAAGYDTDAKVKALGKNVLTAILQYHVVGSVQTAAAIPTADNTPVQTLGGGTVYVTKNANGVSVNGAKVTQADVSATNGVIHVIDKVLIPPAGNIVQIAQADARFSYLVAAVLRASEGSTNVAQVLSGTGPFTVFAPTNDAFKAAGFNTENDIKAADPATLTKILTYHVVSGRVFSTNLTNGNVPTVQGGTVAISLTNGVKVTGASNGGTASNVILADVAATNGVIHAIDRVLLPSN